MRIVIAGGYGGLGSKIVDELMIYWNDVEILDRDANCVPTCDVFIYNCGIGFFAEIENITEEQINEMIQINFIRAVFLTRDIVSKMKAKKSGHIIFTGSNSALKGIPKNSVYAATKAGLLALQRCLELECKPYNVKVSIINPGTIDTDGFWSHGVDNRDKGALNPKEVAKIYGDVIHGNMSIELKVEP